MPKGDYRPLSYADGVAKFLSATKADHNGRTIKDLDEFLAQGLNIANIGKAFNLGWQSAKKMIVARKLELEVHD